MMSLERVRRILRDRQSIEEHAPEARPAAVSLILHETVAGHRTGLEALFIKRAVMQGDPWSGQIALPGGRREPQDADLFATALRETKEETGIDLTRAARLGVLDDLYPRTPTLPPVVVRPFVFAVPSRPPTVTSVEVDHSFWIPLERLLAPGVRHEITLTIRGERRVFPAYDLGVGGEVIWGMTERILTPLLEQLG